MKINFKNQDGLEFLRSLPDNSVDLVLTDPPYITSRDSGMDKWVKHIEAQDQKDAKNIKTEEDWTSFKTDKEWEEWFDKGKVPANDRSGRLEKMKELYLKYGSIYGKKYAVTTDYGSWDSEFTLEKLNLFVEQFYRILKPNGSVIIFFDIWKITDLKNMLENLILKKVPVPKNPKKGESQEDFEKRVKQIEENPYKYIGFSQLRFIEWIKTNPQPINSSSNYLTNCREIALTAVKKGSSTFNSKYDNGIYRHPLQGGVDRFHPTQKSLPLFEELVLKHSNKGDLIVDPFAGSATTACAAINHGRRFAGTEIDNGFYQKAMDRIQRCLDMRKAALREQTSELQRELDKLENLSLES